MGGGHPLPTPLDIAIHNASRPMRLDRGMHGPAVKGTFLVVTRGALLVGTRPQRGGGPPPLYGPQNCRTEQCALSALEILFQAYGRGNFSCSTLCVYTQNTQNFVENSKMAEKHKKGYVAPLPTSGPLLILSPTLKRGRQ